MKNNSDTHACFIASCLTRSLEQDGIPIHWASPRKLCYLHLWNTLCHLIPSTVDIPILLVKTLRLRVVKELDQNYTMLRGPKFFGLYGIWSFQSWDTQLIFLKAVFSVIFETCYLQRLVLYNIIKAPFGLELLSPPVFLIATFPLDTFPLRDNVAGFWTSLGLFLKKSLRSDFRD